MSTIATEQITLARIDDGEMSPEQLAQLNQAATDAVAAKNIADAAMVDVGNLQGDVDELNGHVSDFEDSANKSIELLQSATTTKIDSRTQNGKGFMKWQNDALQIVGINGANYYVTEIGGNGIDFKYGANEADAQTVAKINQNQLEIKQTIVFNEMKVGKWAWTVDNNDSLMLRWAGDN